MKKFLINILKVFKLYNKVKIIENKYNLFIGEGHGHSLLLKILREKKFFSQPGLNFLEIGASREYVFGQGSTKLIATFCEKKKINFISVDADETNVVSIKKDLNKFNFFQIICETGENFTKKNKTKFDIVYLDAFDIETPNIPEKRKNFYKNKFNKQITNQASAEMHKIVIKNLINFLSKNCVIVFDDTFVKGNKFSGKGQTAIPILLKEKFKIIRKNKNSIALGRIENE